MSNKVVIFLVVFALSATKSIGQDKPALEYLVKQELPDSVKYTKLEAMDGSQVILSDLLKGYKGKKVLVTFWASWCRDCLVSLPKYSKLRKKINKTNIVYLMLSVDKDGSKWKSGISKFKIEGDHFRFQDGWKNPFSNYVILDWIPRYMIIDEKGKIVEPKSIQIDDPSIFEALTD